MILIERKSSHRKFAALGLAGFGLVLGLASVMPSSSYITDTRQNEIKANQDVEASVSAIAKKEAELKALNDMNQEADLCPDDRLSGFVFTPGVPIQTQISNGWVTDWAHPNYNSPNWYIFRNDVGEVVGAVRSENGQQVFAQIDLESIDAARACNHNQINDQR